MKTQGKFESARNGGDRKSIARLLDQRFGDGLVYLREAADRDVLRRAIQLGLISADGYLTTSGFRMWQNVTQVG